jgi:hypothetical protein
MPKAQPEPKARQCAYLGCDQVPRFSYSLRFWPVDTPIKYRCRCCALTLACDIVVCADHCQGLRPEQILDAKTRSHVLANAANLGWRTPDLTRAEAEWLSINDEPAPFDDLPDAALQTATAIR